jgi:hypothetical protein
MYNFQKYKISNQYPAKFFSDFVTNILVVYILEISPAQAMRIGVTGVTLKKKCERFITSPIRIQVRPIGITIQNSVNT